MLKLSAQQLAIIAQCRPDVATRWQPHLLIAAADWRINTPQRMAMWLANVVHESAGLTRAVESFAYRTPERLQAVFGRYFKTPQAAIHAIAAGQAFIANTVYAGRMGNGPVASGDGFRFRGRGLIQVTGHDNYAACGQGLGLDLVAHPELLEQPEHAAASAGWFWAENNINDCADAGNFDHACDRINKGRDTAPVGDSNGYADRLAIYKRAKTVLGVQP